MLNFVPLGLHCLRLNILENSQYLRFDTFRCHVVMMDDLDVITFSLHERVIPRGYIFCK